MKLTKLNGGKKENGNTINVGDFNAHSQQWIDHSGKRSNRETADLINTVYQMHRTYREHMYIYVYNGHIDSCPF